MPERSLFYVSRKLVDPDGDAQAIRDIVAISRDKNARLNVTGALVGSTAHFAQILEGPADAVSHLMDSIYRDARHTDIVVVREWAILGRRFTGWSLAYSGASSYVAKHLAGLVVAAGDASSLQVDRAITLITGLAETPD